MSKPQKTIVIVGAGPGGMILAWLLVKNGEIRSIRSGIQA